MLVSGYEELSRRSVGDGNGIWLFCCFDGSLLPFLLASLPSSLPGLWVSCGGEVSKPPQRRGHPNVGPDVFARREQKDVFCQHAGSTR